MRRLIRLFVVTLAYGFSICFAQLPIELPRLNIDINETSVSGISSGGNMAVQLAVAYSSIIKGIGVVAAGPYYCAQQGGLIKAGTECSCTLDDFLCAVTETSARVAELVSKTQEFYNNGVIDNPANISRQRIFTFSGKDDVRVKPEIVNQLGDFYRLLGVPDENLSEISRKAGHTMPTWDYGKACTVTETPYIGKCRYDGAREILSWIYKTKLKRPATDRNALELRYFQFKQRPFIPSEGVMAVPWKNGLDVNGWVFIPKTCEDGEPCRLHVVLHGCRQGQDFMPLEPPYNRERLYGDTFVKQTGYARWAEANNLVVLFPQATSIPVINGFGCWDWWGFTDSQHYADHNGYQMRAIRAMIDQLASGRR